MGPQISSLAIGKPGGQVVAKACSSPTSICKPGSQELTLSFADSICLEDTEEGWRLENSVPSLWDEHKVNI